jgi:DNA-binding response OmpR family regulator
MTPGHVVLVVEDDPETADSLVQIVSAEGWTSVVVDNRVEAIERLRSTSFCAVLLDLQIRGEKRAIRGHTSHGKALLRQIRQLNQEHVGLGFWLPIIVVSGFASERAEAIEIMRDGAAAVIDKPFSDREVAQTLKAELERSGRMGHESCSNRLVLPRSSLERIVLEIPGTRAGRRTQIIIDGRPDALPDSELRTLLELIVARNNGRAVHKNALGSRRDDGASGAKRVSQLRQKLKVLAGVDLIVNDRQGGYRLLDAVVVRSCNASKLIELGDARITELAGEIEKVL